MKTILLLAAVLLAFGANALPSPAPHAPFANDRQTFANVLNAVPDVPIRVSLSRDTLTLNVRFKDADTRAVVGGMPCSQLMGSVVSNEDLPALAAIGFRALAFEGKRCALVIP